MGKQLQTIKNISNEEFAKIVGAIANSTTVMVQGQKFDGRGDHTYGDVASYHRKIRPSTPADNSRSGAILLTVQSHANLEMVSNPSIDNVLDNVPVSKNRRRLQDLLKDLPEKIFNCGWQGGITDIFTNQNGLEMTCILPAPTPPPERNQPRKSPPGSVRT